MKRCNKCGEEKPLSEYHSQRASKDGHKPSCKTCVKAYNAARYQKNKEHMRRVCREWKMRNNDKIRGYNRASYEKDPERFRAYSKKSREKDPQKVAARGALHNAIRRGDIVRSETCEWCDKKCATAGHHWSYLEEHWLDVEWICPKCHTIVHRVIDAAA